MPRIDSAIASFSFERANTAANGCYQQKGLNDLEMVQYCKGPMLEDMSHCVPDWHSQAGEASDAIVSMMESAGGSGAVKIARRQLDSGNNSCGMMMDFGEHVSWADQGVEEGKFLTNAVGKSGKQQFVSWEEVRNKEDDGDGVAPTKSCVTRDSGGLECVLNQTAHSSVKVGAKDETPEVVRDDELEQWLQYPDEALEAEYGGPFYSSTQPQSVQFLKDTLAPGMTTTRLVRSSALAPGPVSGATKEIRTQGNMGASAAQLEQQHSPEPHPYFQSSRAQNSAAALEMAAQRAAGVLPHSKGNPFNQVRTLSGALGAQVDSPGTSSQGQSLSTIQRGSQGKDGQHPGARSMLQGKTSGSGWPTASSNFKNFRAPSLCVFDRSRVQAATSSLGTGTRVRTHSSRDHVGPDPSSASLTPAALGCRTPAPSFSASISPMHASFSAKARPDLKVGDESRAADAAVSKAGGVSQPVDAATGSAMPPPRPVAPWGGFTASKYLKGNTNVQNVPHGVQVPAMGSYAPLSSATSSLRVPEGPASKAVSQGGGDEGRQSVLTAVQRTGAKAWAPETTVTSSSGDSGLIPAGVSKDASQSTVTLTAGRKRGRSGMDLSSDRGDTETLDTRESEDDDTATEPVDTKDTSKAGGKTEGRKGGTSKRSRAAEVHNMSERRRRDRINEKMRALQELIPNSNKTDKASMLDEAIEYLKMLQLQLQVMSMRSGIGIPQLPAMGGQLPGMPVMGLSMGSHGAPTHLGMMTASGDLLAGGMGIVDMSSHDRMGVLAGTPGVAGLHGMGMMDPSMRLYMSQQAHSQQLQQQLHHQQHHSQQAPQSLQGVPGVGSGSGMSLEMFNAYLMQSQGGNSSRR